MLFSLLTEGELDVDIEQRTAGAETLEVLLPKERSAKSVPAEPEGNDGLLPFSVYQKPMCGLFMA